MPMIEVRDVTKVFDRVAALDRASCAIEDGEVVGILGPNGSGKTTLLRLLCAYTPPTSGTVRVAGYDTKQSPLEVRRRVGYVLEGVVLYPDLTVGDFLTFARTVKRAGAQQFADAVARCGLEGWLRRRIGTLSKGYRQRVMLAQALLGDPPVLVLDEPTVGLDPDMAVRVRTLIKHLAGSRTVVLSTHSLAEASALCQRVVVLHHGRVLAHGPPREVFPGLGSLSTFEDAFIRLLAGHGAREQAAPP